MSNHSSYNPKDNINDFDLSRNSGEIQVFEKMYPTNPILKCRDQATPSSNRKFDL